MVGDSNSDLSVHSIFNFEEDMDSSGDLIMIPSQDIDVIFNYVQFNVNINFYANEFNVNEDPFHSFDIDRS